MIRIAKRQLKADQIADDDLTPFIKDKVKMRLLDSRLCKVFPSGRGQYEVREGHVLYPVDMRNRKCMCGVFQIDGVPCRHAMRVIQHNREDPKSYCSQYFTGAMYKAVYELNILPMKDP